MKDEKHVQLSEQEIQMQELIAPCGMNCALCISYQSGEKNLNQQGFHRKTCPGCIPRGQNCLHMGDTCERLAHGSVRFCFECPEYPCKRLKSLDQRYRKKYHMSMTENLEAIRDEGIHQFLAQQEAKWKCPACKGMVCCHNGLCLKCDLEKLKQNRKYCWEDGDTHQEKDKQ